MSNSDHEAPSVFIKASCPLAIAEVYLAGPVLTLTGADWNLTVWCAWFAHGLNFDWESRDLERSIDAFRGRVISDFEVVPDRGPVFALGGASALVLDEKDVDEPIGLDEPWVMSIRGRLITGGTAGAHWS